MSTPPRSPRLGSGHNGSAVRTAVSGGVVPGLDDAPAFTLTSPPRLRLPVLVAVPHAGRAYPPAVTARMRDATLAQLRLEDRYVDRLGVGIARETGAALMVAHAPRALLDLNRAEDDIDWDMIEGGRPDDLPDAEPGQRSNARARSGLGLVPRRLPGSGEIWRGRLAPQELAARIDGIHRAYHEALGQELARIRAEWGAALLIDLHSMPPLRAAEGEARAPLLVLGDRFGASCNNTLMGRALGHLEARRIPASQNRPYSGGYVLDRHGAPHAGVHAVQIEVCRATYLDRHLAEPGAGLPAIVAMLVGLVRELGAEAALLGGGDGLRQAAE
ncbi:N-formylglutamate amidohydrolase [Porphyrobacter sp. ULC335]|uniref:N-formylglutamate amidohydrolase n=1 Tax=Porphyrobacter sp. ULC335 TaxID=2854260 RepID=UPI00221F58F8|nr:N-formylglutamate amidohydrolase [Porphyrobacter sp. ULC335]UYV15075.1 N-formylglutamate amidohydrolase [Porphyrobacter sp. ULC335]